MPECQGAGCTTKPRDPTAIFCSTCRNKTVNKAILAALAALSAPVPAPAAPLVAAYVPAPALPASLTQTCRGQPGCPVTPRNGDMCSTCKKKAASLEKKAAKDTAKFTSVEAMAARQQPAAIRPCGVLAVPSATFDELKSIVGLLTSKLNAVTV